MLVYPKLKKIQIPIADESDARDICWKVRKNKYCENVRSEKTVPKRPFQKDRSKTSVMNNGEEKVKERKINEPRA